MELKYLKLMTGYLETSLSAATRISDPAFPPNSVSSALVCKVLQTRMLWDVAF